VISSGKDNVVSNYDKLAKKIQMAVVRGLLDAGHLVKEKALPITPLKTGHLRDSAFVKRIRVTDRNDTPGVKVGFTAKYALKVHEGHGVRFKVGGPEFLKKAVLENTDMILQKVIDSIKV